MQDGDAIALPQGPHPLLVHDRGEGSDQGGCAVPTLGFQGLHLRAGQAF